MSEKMLTIRPHIGDPIGVVPISGERFTGTLEDWCEDGIRVDGKWVGFGEIQTIEILL